MRHTVERRLLQCNRPQKYLLDLRPPIVNHTQEGISIAIWSPQRRDALEGPRWQRGDCQDRILQERHFARSPPGTSAVRVWRRSFGLLKLADRFNRISTAQAFTVPPCWPLAPQLSLDTAAATRRLQGRQSAGLSPLCHWRTTFVDELAPRFGV
eukprot:scaffold2677_cov220-Pinguiococcus_pyrenoidosus.AAC.2